MCFIFVVVFIFYNILRIILPKTEVKIYGYCTKNVFWLNMYKFKMIGLCKKSRLYDKKNENGWDILTS